MLPNQPADYGLRRWSAPEGAEEVRFWSSSAGERDIESRTLRYQAIELSKSESRSRVLRLLRWRRWGESRAKPESSDKVVGYATIDQSWDILHLFGFLVDKRAENEAALRKTCSTLMCGRTVAVLVDTGDLMIASAACDEVPTALK